tara:strand:- start:356 stop:535 length:180 start_codon:yes stop_codon:yes gene_type:complete
MSDKLTQWKELLEEKLKYKAQVEAALNQTVREILQLEGGIQFAEESTEVNSEESPTENS